MYIQFQRGIFFFFFLTSLLYQYCSTQWKLRNKRNLLKKQSCQSQSKEYGKKSLKCLRKSKGRFRYEPTNPTYLVNKPRLAAAAANKKQQKQQEQHHTGCSKATSLHLCISAAFAAGGIFGIFFFICIVQKHQKNQKNQTLRVLESRQ